ncbi:MAG: HEPN domain-containing protein [Defluviitaleaceae bacterium]|nr:HEPN domain-containing protein [Defluviitaleaceae bacterium]
MKNKTLLDRAKADLFVAKSMLEYVLTDELQYDIVAYHTQQSIEKAMKFAMQCEGIEFLWVHDVDKLFQQMESNNLEPPEWIWDNRKILIDYATQTRYGTDLVATKRDVVNLLQLSEKYILDIEQQQQQQQIFNNAATKSTAIPPKNNGTIS